MARPAEASFSHVDSAMGTVAQSALQKQVGMGLALQEHMPLAPTPAVPALGLLGLGGCGGQAGRQ